MGLASGRAKRARYAIVLTAGAMLLFAPVAVAKPTNPLCEQEEYREAHPLICDTHVRGSGGLPSFPPPGGGNEDGLLDRLLGLVGLGGFL